MTSPTASPQIAHPSGPAPGTTNGLAVAALVVGVIGFLIGLVPVAGLLLGCTAVALGVLAFRRAGGRALAITGISLGSLAALTSLVTTIALIAGLGSTDSVTSSAGAAVVEDAAAPAVESSASTTPAAAAPTPSSNSEAASAPLKTKEAAETKPGADYGGYTKTETRFVSIVEKAADDYLGTSNELKGAKILKQRDTDACSAVDGKVKSWVGTIHSVGATGDGSGWVEVEIAPSIVVETWNNSFSDIGDGTLIKQSATFFDRLSDMDEGARIVFSGNFVRADGSCLKTANLTKTFNAADPNFLFRFSNIRAQ